MTSARRLTAVLIGVALLAALTVGPTLRSNAQQKVQVQVQGKPVQVIVGPNGIIMPGGNTSGETATSALTLPTNNRYRQILKKAQECIEEDKDWGQAVKAIQSLLDLAQDSFIEVPEEGPEQVKSVKAQANKLLAKMPPEGLQFYELQYGPAARARLGEAKAKGDLYILAEVAERYQHTESGAEATIMLATHCLNRDEPLKAALYFDRLFERTDIEKLAPWTLFKASLAYRRAGDPQKSEKLWQHLAVRLQRDGGLHLSQKQFVRAGDLRAELDRAVAVESRTLHEQPIFRGGPTRTEQGHGGAPFMESVWSNSTLPTKSEVKTWAEDMLNHAQRYLAEQRQQPILPAFFPIAVSGKIVYRTYDGIYALDLKKEGKLLWMSHTDGGVHMLYTDSSKKSQLDQWWNVYRQSGPQGVLFENSVTGTLSTDGFRAYVIDDLAIPPHPAYLRNFMFGGQPNYGALTEMVKRNSLKAYNLESGKLVWELGGRFDKDDAAKGTKASELADSFFLGPPLPLGGKLYLLNEKNSELRLVCLEPKDHPSENPPTAPTIVWTQPLATAREQMQFDFNRRVHAAHLAYADGILVCPTNAGRVLGVDLLSHRLFWSRSYRDAATVTEAPPVVNPRIGFVNGMPIANINTEWRIAAPAVHEGKVLFTAPDANALHCLDLRDGKPIWKVARAADDLYFAGVFAGKALIIGKSYVKAYNVADGKEAWPTIANIGLPSGQGAASDNVYYLPLKAGQDKDPEVCAIDIAKGTVIAHTKSRKKEVPGNLIFYEGEVLSQTLTAITAYPQLQAKLAKIDQLIKDNPKDPTGLIERGELRLDNGNLKGAYEDLHLALENNPPADLLPRAKVKLYDTLTEMIQRDFNGSEKFLEEYQALCKVEIPADATADVKKAAEEEQQKRQANYLCLLAKGREKQGRLVDAFQAYLDFGALTGNQELVSVIDEPNTKSPPGVWARGRIAAMLEKASPEQRRPLEEKLAAQWNAIKGTTDLAALRRFADMFGASVAVGRQARLQLAERLLDSAKDPKADAVREAQLLLLQLYGLKAVDQQLAGQAVEALARLMLKKGLMDDAAFYYRKLGQDFAKVVIRDGKTGADLYNELATDKRFLPYLEEPRQSWNGKFNVREFYGNFPMQPVFTLEPIGEVLPFFQKHRLSVDSNTAQVRVVNQLTGQEYWKTQNLPSLQYLNHGQPNVRCTFTVHGHLVVVNLGHMVYGFDPVDQKKLWEYNLYAPGTGSMPTLGQVTRDKDGNLTLMYQDGWSQKLGQAGSVEPSYICLQTRNGLVALDPAKGTLLWTKADVNSARTQIFGDEQYVYLAEVNPDGQVANASRAVRTADGVTVSVPDFKEAYQHRLRVLGRQLLVKDDVEPGVQLRLYDVATGKDAWKKQFPAGTVVLKTDVADQVGTVDPEGNVVVADIASQRELFKATVRKEDLDKLTDAQLLSDRDQYYLILNKAADPNLNNGIWMNVFHGMRCQTVNGMIYAFERDTGKQRWVNSVANQMLVLDQFRDLPVLLFTARYNKWIANGANRFAQHVVAAKSIHKATGKLLYDKELSNNINNFHAVVADPKAGTIDLISFNLKIRHQLEPVDSQGAAPQTGAVANGAP